jgi:hypothetical protein
MEATSNGGFIVYMYLPACVAYLDAFVTYKVKTGL